MRSRPEPLEPVPELWALAAFVGELSDEQRKRLRVTGRLQGADIHRIETHIANELRGNFLAPRIVAAIHKARLAGIPPRFVNVEEHFARYGIECTHDASLGCLGRQCFGARG